MGTSGFNYPHWRGCFYPERLPASRWLAFYARHFEAVELNVTFYRLPSAEAFGRWAQSVPEGFRFVVKGSRFITHIRRLRGCEGPLEELLGRASELGERLAAILWQLPPGFPADPGRLEAFMGLLAGHPLGRRIRHAFEFREASWFAPPVMALLARYDAAAVLADWPFRGLRAEPAARWVYVRRHGPGAPYQDSYPDAMLAEDARAIRDWLRSGRDVLCFFNNDVAGHAVHDALRLRAMVEGARLRAPGEAPARHKAAENGPPLRNSIVQKLTEAHRCHGPQHGTQGPQRRHQGSQNEPGASRSPPHHHFDNSKRQQLIFW